MDTKFNESLDYIRKLYSGSPKVGIVLGTGLGGLVREIKIEKEIPYNFIPHFPISTVESHFGKLIFGKMGDKSVVAMQGRFHFYEGYDMAQITFPIRIMKLLGVETLYISNAAGSVNPNIKKGSLMAIDDHINLQGMSPLIGPNLDAFGPRFPDMSRPYDTTMILAAEKIAKEENITLHKGVYVALVGPNLETRAEYRFLRIISAEVVGMSTVPEVIVARALGMRVAAVSCITNNAAGMSLAPLDHSEVMEVGRSVAARFEGLITEFVRHLP